MKNKHIVLLGDSVFDNKSYVLYDEPDVITQVEQAIGTDNKATLLAVDGSCLEDIPEQLRHLPKSADYLFLSTGGNNLLGQMSILRNECSNVIDALKQISRLRLDFSKKYGTMLDAITRTGKPIVACTIYYPRFSLQETDWIGLTSSVSNWKKERHLIQDAINLSVDVMDEAIIDQLLRRNIPVMDLRKLCNEDKDFANPIEPSQFGGAKIANVIQKVSLRLSENLPVAQIITGN